MTKENGNGITSWTNKSKFVHGVWTAPKDIPEYRVQMINLIVEELERNPKATIMDCGCGTGLIYKYLPDEYKNRYYGADFTQEMIDYCKEAYPEIEDRFMQLDLTQMSLEQINFFIGKNVYVTQNVIQHILLFQRALNDIIECAETIIMCERTHDLPTCIAGYEPAYRWRFNLRDFYDILTSFTEENDYLGEVEIMGQPLTTDNLEKTVTIFRARKDVGWKVSDAEYDFYVEEYFGRRKTIIREYIYKPRKRDRIIKFFKSLNPF